MLESLKTGTEGNGERECSETTSRRRFLYTTAAAGAAISALGSGTAAAARRYQTRRLRTDTPGQSAIEDVVLVHDRRLFDEDVFYVSVELTEYAMRYDRQRVTVSESGNWEWNWDGTGRDRSVGDSQTRRLLSEVDMPALRTPARLKPLPVKVWTETGSGNWLTQERIIVEPAGVGEP